MKFVFATTSWGLPGTSTPRLYTADGNGLLPGLGAEEEFVDPNFETFRTGTWPLTPATAAGAKAADEPEELLLIIDGCEIDDRGPCCL